MNESKCLFWCRLMITQVAFKSKFLGICLCSFKSPRVCCLLLLTKNPYQFQVYYLSQDICFESKSFFDVAVLEGVSLIAESGFWMLSLQMNFLPSIQAKRALCVHAKESTTVSLKNNSISSTEATMNEPTTYHKDSI